MLIAYLAFGSLLGIFMSFIWSSNGGLNCLIKTAFVVWSLWSIAILAMTIFPTLTVAMPR